MSVVASRWGFVAHKLSAKTYRLDFALHTPDKRRVVMAFAEYKRRHVRSDKYPNYRLSLLKVQAADSASVASGKPTVLVVEFDDGVWFARIAGLDRVMRGETIISGRTDRGDPADEEPMVEFAVADMTRLAGT